MLLLCKRAPCQANWPDPWYMVAAGLDDEVERGARARRLGALGGRLDLNFVVGAEIAEELVKDHAVIHRHVAAGLAIGARRRRRRAAHRARTDVGTAWRRGPGSCPTRLGRLLPQGRFSMLALPQFTPTVAASRSIVGALLDTVTLLGEGAEFQRAVDRHRGAARRR